MSRKTKIKDNIRLDKELKKLPDEIQDFIVDFTDNEITERLTIKTTGRLPLKKN